MNSDSLTAVETGVRSELVYNNGGWLVYLNPEHIDTLRSHLDTAYGSNSQALCAVEIINMADILATYGSETYSNVATHICQAVKQILVQEIEIIQAGLDKFLFIIKVLDPSMFQSLLREVVEKIIMLPTPTPGEHAVLTTRVGLMSPIGLDLEEAVTQAHIALKHAIAHNPNKRVVSYEDTYTVRSEATNNMRLASYLLQAMQEERVGLAFQPVVLSKTGEVKKYESLLRIITEDGQVISAGPFIAAAELLGCIHRVDNMVLERVVAELKADDKVHLAMNISNLSVDNADWLKKARTLLSDEQITARLTIEITETGTQHNLEKMARLVDELKCLGCNVAIDDFGAGHTSFKQLKVLHADYIKIDGAFVRNIVEDDDNRLFVKTLITFAKSFGIQSVAEFVETGEVAKVLLELGVDYMQGNYFGAAINYRPWVEN